MSDFRIKDKKGNHILVALSDADRLYKSAFLEDEDLDTPIIEISIEKEHPGIPLEGIVFPRVASLLVNEIEHNPDAVYYYTVSLDELPEEHGDKTPQEYRYALFTGLEELLKSRCKWPNEIQTISKEIGVGEYASVCKIFYRPAQTHIARMIVNGITNSKP